MLIHRQLAGGSSYIRKLFNRYFVYSDFIRETYKFQKRSELKFVS